MRSIAFSLAVSGFLLGVSLGFAPVDAAVAQSQADFTKAFSGKWQTYDPQMSSGSGLCRFDLSGQSQGERMPVTVTGCAAPLAGATSWSIEGSQLVLADSGGKPLVRLGGNQKRITGATPDGIPVVLERAGGDGTAAALEADYNASGCYYLGYTQKCSSKVDLGKPAMQPTGRTQVHVEVNLNAHSEPRADADTVGVVHQNTCVAVETCIMASDGPWCRAAFGSTTGWLRKLAIRQNRWAVVTFTNSCS
ncbi:MAG: AprI/Inh family metalloprotease inhibitor [Devosia sp.]